MTGRVSGTWKRPGKGGNLVSKVTTIFQPVLRESEAWGAGVPTARAVDCRFSTVSSSRGHLVGALGQTWPGARFLEQLLLFLTSISFSGKTGLAWMITVDPAMGVV